MVQPRRQDGTPTGLQDESRRWWNATPMAYDWRQTVVHEEGTPGFFEEIDRRFFASSPFYRGNPPFARLIPFDQLSGKRVLEVGCGMGAHAQLFAQAGCNLSAIDLTERAATATATRLAIRELHADVRVMDAERLDFPDGHFDFVWSWGVIHHSNDPERITQEVLRVLRPGGEFRCMVYHRRSIDAVTALVRGVVTGKLARGMSVAEVLSHYTDGWIARYYTPGELRLMLNRSGFTGVETQILGQTAELVPLPGGGRIGRAKTRIQSKIPNEVVEFVSSRVGSFLFVIGRKDPAAAPT